MRVALHSILVPGQEAAYEQVHAAIWPDMVASLQSAGVHDWTIWRSGSHLFHVVDCDDFDIAMTTLGADPVNERWQEYMANYVERLVPDEHNPDQLALRHVWTLAAQLQAESTANAEAGA